MGQLGNHLRRLDLNLLLYINYKLGWDMLAKKNKRSNENQQKQLQNLGNDNEYYGLRLEVGVVEERF